ncbi:MAG: hypothetical protein ACJ8DZ_14015 [Allosphingosinicella sp.]
MDFAEAWDALGVGDQAAVSNGQPRPPGTDTSFAVKVWRSHNFTGTLAEKPPGPPRGLRFDLPADANGTVIGYTVLEGVGHIFEPA